MMLLSPGIQPQSGEIFIFISLYSTQHLLDNNISSLVRALKEKGSKVIIGGPVTADPEIALGELKPDLVVTGEGE